jgi:hypothetical protein
MTYCSQRGLPTIQLFAGAGRLWAHSSTFPILGSDSADMRDRLEQC